MNQNLKEKAQKQFQLQGKTYHYYSLAVLKEEGYDINHLPYSIKILLESLLRQCDGFGIREEHIRNLADWAREHKKQGEIPFKPSRVILQDFTGVPAVVDLASMRDAMASIGGSKDLIHKINPEVPVDLVIDHSVQVDCYGTRESLNENMKLEFERNKERYEFLN